MALARVVVVVAGLLLVSVVSSQPQFSSTLEPKKENPHCFPVHRLRSCWKDYFDLPSCGNERSAMVTCGENVGRTMERCDDPEVINYAGIIIRSFRTSDKTLCSNKDLRDYFRDNGFCWSQARTCVKDMLFSDDRTVHDCEAIATKYDRCLNDVPSQCIKQVKKYGKHMREHLPCAACAATAVPTLVLALSVFALARFVS